MIERFKSSVGSLLGGELASESSKRFVEEFTKLDEHNNVNSNERTERGYPREKMNFDRGSTANDPQNTRAGLESPKKPNTAYGAYISHFFAHFWSDPVRI